MTEDKYKTNYISQLQHTIHKHFDPI